VLPLNPQVLAIWHRTPPLIVKPLKVTVCESVTVTAKFTPPEASLIEAPAAAFSVRRLK